MAIRKGLHVGGLTLPRWQLRILAVQAIAEEALMETRRVFALVVVVLLATTVLPLNIRYAQDLEGRWPLEINTSGNMRDNHDKKRVVGEGGKITVHYGFTPRLSVGLQMGCMELKSNRAPSLDGVAHLS
jgi:hypothetical protein